MPSKLDTLCAYAKGKIAVEALNAQTYISTENMMPNKGGIAAASSLPSVQYTQQYLKGDVLVSNIRPYFKKIWMAEYDGGCSNDVLVFRANSSCDPTFLYYVLANDVFFDYATATSKGTKMPRGDKTAIMQYDVPNYDMDTQLRIGKLLRSLDDRIATNKKINDNLLAQAQAIFMQRFITDEIEGDEKPLYDFADYINGAAFKPSECGDHGLPIIKIVELKNGITDSTKYFDGFKGEKYLIQDKDILFSWSGNPDTSIDIFIWTHGKAILNQHTFNVKSNTGHRWFTFLMLKYFKPEFSRIASNKQTTGLGHVTAADLKRLTFVFNEDAIEAFEHEVNPFMETIYSNMMENNRLEQLRDNLLPKLMSGEIDVSDIQL